MGVRGSKPVAALGVIGLATVGVSSGCYVADCPLLGEAVAQHITSDPGPSTPPVITTMSVSSATTTSASAIVEAFAPVVID